VKQISEAWDEQRERLLESPCYVIDFLPRQVPADSEGNYFGVERFLTEHPRLEGLYRRFARLVLCLSCYDRMAANLDPEEEWSGDPTPEELTGLIEVCAGDEPAYVSLLLPGEDALLTLDGGDLYMSVYHPSEDLLDLIRQLAAAEGLFVREGA